MGKTATQEALTITGNDLSTELTDDERERIRQTAERLLESRKLPVFENNILCDRDGRDELLAYATVMDICKTDDINAALALVSGASAGQLWQDDPDKEKTKALAQMAQMNPQTYLEAMLISQMVAVNSAITKTFHRALLPEQTSYGKETNMAYATKLQRTFLQQVEALQKLKGKGQQTVRVEHVTVNAGGQAVVGHIEHKPGGRGKNGK